MKRLVLVAMVVAGLAWAQPAQAAVITGGISFAGGAVPTPASINWATATGVNFVECSVCAVFAPGQNKEGFVQSGSGTYAGTAASFVDFSDFTFNPVPGGGVNPLWTFTKSGVTYSFNLSSMVILQQNLNVLSLVGRGTLLVTGFDATPGTFTFTGNQNDANFSFSASNEVVPEPGTMILMGTALLGLAAVARRRRKA